MGISRDVFLRNYWVDFQDLGIYRRLKTSLRATIIFQVYTVTNFGAKAELLTPTPRGQFILSELFLKNFLSEKIVYFVGNFFE